jgi:hypothetical protein
MQNEGFGIGEGWKRRQGNGGKMKINNSGIFDHSAFCILHSAFSL